MNYITNAECSYSKSISELDTEESTAINEYSNHIFSDNELPDVLKNHTKEKPKVAVRNPDDITEVAIKYNLFIGQIYKNGWSELCETIGITNLNMKQHDGENIEELKGGKQKVQAKKIILQYVNIAERKDIGRYAIQVTDIFEQPTLSVADGRGKDTNGFFSKRMLPSLINYLICQNDNGLIYSDALTLSKVIGLVNHRYRSDQDFSQIDKRFTVNMVKRFYSTSKRELERIIYRLLDNLQNNYGVISYERKFWISTSDEKRHLSSANDKLIICKSEKIILEEFKTSCLFTIYARNQQDRFYKRVIDYINENYNLNWTRYQKQIEIKINNIDALKELSETLVEDNKQVNEARNRLATNLHKIISTNYKQTNDNELQTVLNDPEVGDEFKSLLEAEIYSVRDLVQKGVVKNPPFHYWESSLKTQFDLISLMIGKVEDNLSDNELEEPEMNLSI